MQKSEYEQWKIPKYNSMYSWSRNHIGDYYFAEFRKVKLEGEKLMHEILWGSVG